MNINPHRAFARAPSFLLHQHSENAVPLPLSPFLSSARAKSGRPGASHPRLSLDRRRRLLPRHQGGDPSAQLGRQAEAHHADTVREGLRQRLADVRRLVGRGLGREAPAICKVQELHLMA